MKEKIRQQLIRGEFTPENSNNLVVANSHYSYVPGDAYPRAREWCFSHVDGKKLSFLPVNKWVTLKKSCKWGGNNLSTDSVETLQLSAGDKIRITRIGNQDRITKAFVWRVA